MCGNLYRNTQYKIRKKIHKIESACTSIHIHECIYIYIYIYVYIYIYISYAYIC